MPSSAASRAGGWRRTDRWRRSRDWPGTPGRSLAGLAGHARQVGYALAALPEGSRVPWQRVINAKGEVSPRAERGADHEQRARLEAEGVVFGESGRVSLARFGWRPRG
jgi:methylated-DNA-protein-cysteine methyltransferase-like protein